MGIGGGAILIPALVMLLNIEQHNAQGINLVFFIPTAIAALVVHVKNKNVYIKTVFQIAIWGIVGAVLGANIAVAIPAALLKKMFGIFLLLMGTYEIYKGIKMKCQKAI